MTLGRGLAAALALGAIAALPLRAQDALPIPGSLLLEGVPPIPAEIEAKVRPYGEFRPHRLLSWHPVKREILVRRRLAATSQVHHVTEPLTTPQPLTDFANAVTGAAYQPTHGTYFVFPMAWDGNEANRLYRYDVATKEVTEISPAGERASDAAFNRRGDRLVYATATLDRNNPERASRRSLHVVDPLKPASDKVIARFDSAAWTGFRFSEDGRQLVFVDYLSASESHLWVMEVATGKRRRVTASGKDEPVWYGPAVFSRDGKGVYTTSNRGSEFKRLVYLPLAGGKERVLTERHAYDVDDFEVSYDANLIAFVTNESGSSVLRFHDLKAMKELPRPPLFPGVIGGLEWRKKSSEVGFHISSARSAGDVFSYDVKANRLARWTNGNNPQVNTSDFAEPRLVKWKSFDGREITGFHYHPPERFTGKRPVIIDVHGGPESQYRPAFIGRDNYFLGELGVAMIFPNVRGSTGFGKTFMTLDNGTRREDAVRDIGALLGWIREQPNLDAGRVMISGGSYGGYIALATAIRFGDSIASAMSVAGISNFVTFLERTESYRRDLRRAEYGDERDPVVRDYLESISPLTHADRITRPLFVVHGQNDPRVPYAEAEQIVASLKRRKAPVWFMTARDEGHGYVKRPNADYLFYSMVEFVRRTLLQ